MRTRLLLAVIFLSGCGRADPAPRELGLASAGSSTVARSDTSSCAVRLHISVRLSGILQRRIHLGPPGYGETPVIDTRDTSWVVRMSSPLPACNAEDPSADSARREVQLVAPPEDVWRLERIPFTVYGRLDRATFGWHRTPYVIVVDSIPALNALAGGRSKVL